jgi:hypothetical protein
MISGLDGEVRERSDQKGRKPFTTATLSPQSINFLMIVANRAWTAHGHAGAEN